jgi:NTE family protein
MGSASKSQHRLYRSNTLPAGHQYHVLALLLQGGGALGSYQPGVYQGLAEADLHPNWVAGISIGALNAAIIAGNPPDKRVDQLRRFWETICQPPLLPASPINMLDTSQWPDPMQHMLAGWEAWRSLLEGQNGFYRPRLPWNFHQHSTPAEISFYDTSPLKQTLEQLVDFDRLNDSRQMRGSVGAVNVRSGNFIYFDNTHMTLRAEHFIASGALPPGFPAVEIDGEFYWDGGVVSNTPLSQLISKENRDNTLAFQVDLWSARGNLPGNMKEVAMRQKDIQYSSRTRMVTDVLRQELQYRELLSELMALVPKHEHGSAAFLAAQHVANCQRLNVIHLIYQDKIYDDHYKDYQFGLQTMRQHWHSGYQDIRNSLTRPGWLDMPSAAQPFVSHDIHR